MVSKYALCGWGTLATIFFTLFCYQVYQLVSYYLEYPIQWESSVRGMKTLPLPSLVICARSPINELMMSSQNIGFEPRQPGFANYMRNFVSLPVDERVEISDSELLRTAESDFKAYLNSTAANKTTIESLMHTCQDMISSCKSGSKTMSGEECCAQMKYALTSAGICLTKLEEIQEGPGEKNGLEISFTVLDYPDKTKSQGQNGFQIFLTTDDRQMNALQGPIEIESGKVHHIELTMESSYMLSEPYSETCSGDYSADSQPLRFQCYKEQMNESCGCLPLLSIWDGTDVELEFEGICTEKQTVKCADKYLDTWPLDAIDKMDWGSNISENNPACRPVIPCEMTTWDPKHTQSSLEKINADSFEAKVLVYYRHMIKKMMKQSATMSLAKLLREIGIQICIWFVLFHLILYPVTFIQECCCNSNNRLDLEHAAASNGIGHGKFEY